MHINPLVFHALQFAASSLFVHGSPKLVSALFKKSPITSPVLPGVKIASAFVITAAQRFSRSSILASLAALVASFCFECFKGAQSNSKIGDSGISPTGIGATGNIRFSNTSIPLPPAEFPIPSLKDRVLGAFRDPAALDETFGDFAQKNPSLWESVSSSPVHLGIFCWEFAKHNPAIFCEGLDAGDLALCLYDKLAERRGTKILFDKGLLEKLFVTSNKKPLFPNFSFKGPDSNEAPLAEPYAAVGHDQMSSILDRTQDSTSLSNQLQLIGPYLFTLTNEPGPLKGLRIGYVNPNGSVSGQDNISFHIVPTTKSIALVCVRSKDTAPHHSHMGGVCLELALPTDPNSFLIHVKNPCVCRFKGPEWETIFGKENLTHQERFKERESDSFFTAIATRMGYGGVIIPEANEFWIVQPQAAALAKAALEKLGIEVTVCQKNEPRDPKITAISIKTEFGTGHQLEEPLLATNSYGQEIVLLRAGTIMSQGVVEFVLSHRDFNLKGNENKESFVCRFAIAVNNYFSVRDSMEQDGDYLLRAHLADRINTTTRAVKNALTFRKNVPHDLALKWERLNRLVPEQLKEGVMSLTRMETISSIASHSHAALPAPNTTPAIYLLDNDA